MTKQTTSNRTKALKDFFSTEEKPITFQELKDFRQNDPKGYDELADLCVEALSPKE